MRFSRQTLMLPAAVLFAIALSACGGSDGPTLTDAGPLTSTVGDVDDAIASTGMTDTVGDVVDATTQTVGDVIDVASPPNPNPLLSLADTYTARVASRRGHDTNAFTQGLEFFNDRLFESRGQYGESALTEIDALTGEVIRAVALGGDDFAEGLTRVDDQIIVLTWESERALVYDLETFEPIDTFSYNGEGWGLCNDGTALWMSNGSNTLTRRDPYTFEASSEIGVFFQGTPVFNLNELECIDGLVWANVWKTDMIVVIDPVTGEVVARIDASALRADLGLDNEGDEVLNGIAYDEVANRLLLTGKYWPSMYEVELVPCTEGCEMPELQPE